MQQITNQKMNFPAKWAITKKKNALQKCNNRKKNDYSMIRNNRINSPMNVLIVQNYHTTKILSRGT